MSKMNIGRSCSVINCPSTDRNLKTWKASECSIHRDCQGLPLANKDCPCLVPYSFHFFPREEAEKLNWIRALQRKDFHPKKKSSVCSLHFLDGKPTKDFPYPSENLGHHYSVSPGRRILKRKITDCRNASIEDRKRLNTSWTKETSSNLNTNTTLNLSTDVDTTLNLSTDVDTTLYSNCNVGTTLNSSTNNDLTFLTEISDTETNLNPNKGEESVPSNLEDVLCVCKKKCKGITIGTQWEDPTMIDHVYSILEPRKFVVPKFSRSTQVHMHEYENHLTTKDCKFLTGLDLVHFTLLVNMLSNLNLKLPCALKITDQILLVLMKLRLNLLFQDLGRRFHISGSLAGRIFKFWLNIMYDHLKEVICWLPRETIRSTLPSAFKVNYPRTTCIIDCSEVFIQRPRKLRARALTYSNYKSHNTLKFSTVIAPSGFIMQVSRCYGGRTSDNFITRDSGIFSLLRPGDEVMADRGFTISDDLDFIKVKLNIPSFTHKKQHLEEGEVTRTRRIATVRIEVERVIGKLKCFNILKSVLPLHFYKKVDKIITVCAALCNLQPSISKKEQT